MADLADYYQNTRLEVLQLVPSEYRTVLEIGCGAGAFAAQLSRDAEIWGVEPNDEAAARAAARLQRVLHGPYDAMQSELPEQYFDLVICNDVIEHVADEVAFLTSIRRKLRPGGHLVGSVPNVRFVKTLAALLFAKDWRYQDSGVLDRTHLRYFTGKSLRRTLRAAGFEVRLFRGINSAFGQIQGTKSLLKAIGTLAVVLATFGWWYDIQFQQWGFRAAVSPARETGES